MNCSELPGCSCFVVLNYMRICVMLDRSRSYGQFLTSWIQSEKACQFFFISHKKSMPVLEEESNGVKSWCWLASFTSYTSLSTRKMVQHFGIPFCPWSSEQTSLSFSLKLDYLNPSVNSKFQIPNTCRGRGRPLDRRQSGRSNPSSPSSHPPDQTPEWPLFPPSPPLPRLQAAAAMAFSTHLLSQSLYPSHRSNPAAPRHLRFQARPAAASPGVRSSSSTRSRRALGLRVAASAEQGRRQVEVIALPTHLLSAGIGKPVTELVDFALHRCCFYFSRRYLWVRTPVI